MDYYTQIFDKQPLTDYSYYDISSGTSGNYVQMFSWFNNGIYYTQTGTYKETINLVSGTAGMNIPDYFSITFSGAGNIPYYAIQTGQIISIYQSAGIPILTASFPGQYPQLVTNRVFTYIEYTGYLINPYISCIYSSVSGLVIRSSQDNFNSVNLLYSGNTNLFQDVILLNPPYTNFIGICGFDNNLSGFLISSCCNYGYYNNLLTSGNFSTYSFLQEDIQTFSGLSTGITYYIPASQYLEIATLTQY